MASVTIGIKAELGEHCVTIAQGEQIYEKIHPRLLNEDQVQLDFAGVTVFSSPFFNAAIGQLLKDLKPEQLNRLLRIDNLAPYGMETMTRVIANSREYYTNPEMRKAIDAFLTEKFRDQ